MDIPKRVCECAYHYNTDTDAAAIGAGGEHVCSSQSVIHRLKEFLLAHRAGGKSETPQDAVEVMREVGKVVGCTLESCTLTRPEVVAFLGRETVRRELANNFKPSGPALNYRKLINNENIDSVLDQVAQAYPGFYHIPFQMIDFARMAKSDEELLQKYGNSIDGQQQMQYEKDRNLATIDIADKFNKGYRTFGVVLNTDISSGPGKHWFCIFIDLRGAPGNSKFDSPATRCPAHEHGNQKERTIEFFNSSSKGPLVPVMTWLYDTQMKLMPLDKTIKVRRVITRPLQFDDYSCGVWSLYYIISRILCHSYEDFSDGKMDDKMMYEYRKHLFRHFTL